MSTLRQTTNPIPISRTVAPGTISRTMIPITAFGPVSPGTIFVPVSPTTPTIGTTMTSAPSLSTGTRSESKAFVPQLTGSTASPVPEYKGIFGEQYINLGPRDCIRLGHTIIKTDKGLFCRRSLFEQKMRVSKLLYSRLKDAFSEAERNGMTLDEIKLTIRSIIGWDFK